MPRIGILPSSEKGIGFYLSVYHIIEMNPAFMNDTSDPHLMSREFRKRSALVGGALAALAMLLRSVDNYLGQHRL